MERERQPIKISPKMEMPEKPKKGEISEEDIEKKLARLGDLEELAERMREPFIPEVIESLARLVIKLEPRLPEYDTVLSDDASGRIPSLLLRKIINHVREGKGLPPARIYFLAAGRHGTSSYEKKTEAVADFLSAKQSGMKKALLATEFVSSGNSLFELMHLVRKAGIDFDTAALSLEEPFGEYVRAFGDSFEGIIYGADDSNTGLKFYNEYSLTGVAKDNGSLSPHPESRARQIREKMEAGKELSPEEELKIRQAREDMDLLAREFIDKLLDKAQN